jgi:hypothetical protein
MHHNEPSRRAALGLSRTPHHLNRHRRPVLCRLALALAKRLLGRRDFEVTI